MKPRIATVWIADVRSDPGATSILTDRELATFDALNVAKRKDDWLAGRIAAKRAGQRRTGLPLAAHEVLVEPGGRPTLRAGGKTWFVSITHSSGLALAVADRVPIGIDLEALQVPRPGMLQLVLRHDERRQLAPLPVAAQGERLTELWCLKEAYAKMLGEGLRIPFQDLVVPTDVHRETVRLGTPAGPLWFAVVGGSGVALGQALR